MLNKDQVRYIRIFYDVLKIPEPEIARHYEIKESVIVALLHGDKAPGQPKVSKEKLAPIFRKWVAGATIGALAKQHDQHPQTLRRRMRWYGLSFAPTKYHERKKRDVRYAFSN